MAEVKVSQTQVIDVHKKFAGDYEVVSARENFRYCGRSGFHKYPHSKWNNPFSAKKVTDGKVPPELLSLSLWEPAHHDAGRRGAVLAYAHYLITGRTCAKSTATRPKLRLVGNVREELAGKVLGCWCHEPGNPKLCHTHILLMIADGGINEWLASELSNSPEDLAFLQAIWDEVLSPIFNA